MTILPADCYTAGQLPGKSIVIGWFPGNVAFYTLSGTSNSLGWDTAVGYLNFDPFGAGTNLPNRTSLVELLTVFDTEQPKRERVQKAQDYYQGLLRAYDPKLNMRKLDPKRKSRTIMSFDITLERHNKNLFLGAQESDIVARLSKVLEKFYGEPPFDDIDIDLSVHHPFILHASRA